MSKKKELLFNTIIIAIGKFSTQIVSVILLPLYTSILTTEEYGVYDLIMTISVFLVPIITLLMEESMFRFLIDCKSDEDKNKVISQTFIYILISSIVFTTIILIIGKIFNISNIGIIVLFLISNIVVALRNSIIRGLGKIKLFSLSNFITSLILILSNIVFIVVFKTGYIGLLYSGIIANIGVSIIVFIKLKIFNFISIKHFDKTKMKEMIKYSVPLVPNSVSWAIINLSDRVIISSIIGPAQNGIYSMSYKFPNFMDTIYGFFYTAWKESASKAIRDENSLVFYNNIYNMLKKFMIAIVLGMIACMPLVFPILIKGEFIEAYKYIPILIIATYYSNISGFFGGIFAAYKDTKVMGSTTIISALINIIVNIIFIKFIGLWAAAISTLIATFFVYFMRRIKLKKYIELKDKTNIFTVMLLVTLLITYYINNLIINIIILVLVVIYCIYLNKEFLTLILNSIRKKINVV